MNSIIQKLSSKGAAIYAGVIWVIIYFLVRLALNDPWLPHLVRVVIAIIPIVPFALFVIFVLAHIRQMDELHRKVHLEALAIAFPLAMLLLMLLGLLELVIPLSPENWSYRHTWYFLPLFYFTGLAFTWRRYQ